MSKQCSVLRARLDKDQAVGYPHQNLSFEGEDLGAAGVLPAAQEDLVEFERLWMYDLTPLPSCDFAASGELLPGMRVTPLPYSRQPLAG